MLLPEKQAAFSFSLLALRHKKTLSLLLPLAQKIFPQRTKNIYQHTRFYTNDAMHQTGGHKITISGVQPLCNLVNGHIKYPALNVSGLAVRVTVQCTHCAFFKL